LGNYHEAGVTFQVFHAWGKQIIGELAWENRHGRVNLTRLVAGFFQFSQQPLETSGFTVNGFFVQTYWPRKMY